jgi:regulator of replication initiation timing
MKEIEKIEKRLGKGELWADEHIQILLASLKTKDKEIEKLKQALESVVNSNKATEMQNIAIKTLEGK